MQGQLYYLMLLPYFTNEGVEHVIHVPPVRCARLVEGAAELLCQVLALPGVHWPHRGLEVHLVGHQDHGDILGGPHLGDKVPVFYSLVKTMSEKEEVLKMCNLQYKGLITKRDMIETRCLIVF